MKTYLEFVSEAKTPFVIKPYQGTKEVYASDIIHPESQEKNMGSTSVTLCTTNAGWKDFKWLFTESSWKSKNKKWKVEEVPGQDYCLKFTNITKKEITFGDFKKELEKTLKAYELDGLTLFTYKRI